MSDLKRCPFCGKPGERWIDRSGDSDAWMHGCMYCGVSIVFYGDEEEWNTRPIEDKLRAEIELLRSKLLLVLDQVDYTGGSCKANDMVGAVLDRGVIVSIREALKGTTGKDAAEKYTEYEITRNMHKMFEFYPDDDKRVKWSK